MVQSLGCYLSGLCKKNNTKNSNAITLAGLLGYSSESRDDTAIDELSLIEQRGFVGRGFVGSGDYDKESRGVEGRDGGGAIAAAHTEFVGNQLAGSTYGGPGLGSQQGCTQARVQHQRDWQLEGANLKVGLDLNFDDLGVHSQHPVAQQRRGEHRDDHGHLVRCCGVPHWRRQAAWE